MRAQRCLRYVVVLALVAMYAASCAVKQHQKVSTDLSGTYRCEGTALNKHYMCFVHIQQAGEIFNVLWTNDAGMITGIGVGIRTADVLSVIFQTDSGGVSVASYAIERDGTLNGRWYSGENATSPERVTRVPAGHAPTPIQHPPVNDPRVRV